MKQLTEKGKTAFRSVWFRERKKERSLFCF